MAKGSVRKKGKKWYYRFYVEDASGNRVQKEFPGTESKSETESLLRKAMEDYETKMFLAQAKNITLGDMLDMWVEEELKPGSLSDGTVTAYINTVSRIKKHPIGKRKLKTVTSDHLQSYMDLLSFGGTSPDGKTVEALSKGSLGQYSAVLQNSFRFAVFPKRLITFNPMQYVVWRGKKEDYDLFSDEDGDTASTPTLSHEQYLKLEEFLKKKNNPALLPIQIAYYTGLRIGEVCGLTWQDINLEKQYLTVRRSMRYNSASQDEPLGTLAGRGVTTERQKGGHIRIKVTEPCYIMCICSITPRIDYGQGNTWDTYLSTMNDWHKPALDGIGYQDSLNGERAWWTDHIKTNGGPLVKTAAGKTVAWINYMTNVNRTFGNFAPGMPESFMVLNRNYSMNNQGQIEDLTTYIDPVKFNYIFADTNLDAMNFWVQTKFDIKVRRLISAKQIPNL